MQAEIKLEQLILNYQNLIFSICYRFTNNTFDAEDLMQDTFLSAFSNLDYFDGKSERTWLCRIATNKCIDYLRLAERRSYPTEESYFRSIIADNETPEIHCIESELLHILFNCCKKLKSPYNSVALDYFYYQLEINEIVKKTGKNKKTLQTQIYRAKNMLKNLMISEGYALSASGV